MWQQSLLLLLNLVAVFTSSGNKRGSSLYFWAGKLTGWPTSHNTLRHHQQFLVWSEVKFLLNGLKANYDSSDQQKDITEDSDPRKLP